MREQRMQRLLGHWPQRLAGFGLAAVLALWAEEACVSQVVYAPIKIPLQNLVWTGNPLIVLVRGPEGSEVLQEVTLPRETHHSRSEVNRYTDLAALYRIVRVLDGADAKVAAGETIKVWLEPAYDLHLVEEYHTKGISKSPIIHERLVEFPITGEERILFLQPVTIAGKPVWSEAGHEGPGAEPEILRLLAVPMEQRRPGKVILRPQD